MLQLIRNHVQGIVVWAIVGLIIVSFALFGLDSYLTGTARGANVATVNGTEITENEFLRAYYQQQERLRAALGENYRPGMFDESRMRQQVLETLVNREVMNQWLDKAGFAAPTQVLAQRIHGMEVFQEEQGFSRARYEQVLRFEGLSSDRFEALMARDVMGEQLQTGLVATAFVTETEFDAYRNLLTQERDIGVMVFPAGAFEQASEISEAEVQAYYERNAARFSTPEQVALDYLELSLADLAAGQEIPEERLKQYYEEHRELFQDQREERRVRHILVAVDADADTDAAAAEARIQALQAKLQAGEAFEALARGESEDPGSASEGGDLGYVTRGMLDPAFEQAAFALQSGQISAPVRSSFGYHLIKVDDVRGGEVTPFAEARPRIERELQLQAAQSDFYQLSELLTNLTYEHPDTLEVAARELGLTVQQSPLFGRNGGAGIAAHRRVVEAAFSEDVLEAGHNSEPVEVETNHLVVVRVRERVPPAQQGLGEVRDRIVAQLRREAAQAAAQAAAEQAAARLRKGEDPAAVAEAHPGVEWTRAGFVAREPRAGETLAPEVRARAFQLPAPQGESPSLDVLNTARGDAALVALYGMRAGEAQAAPIPRQRLAQAHGVADYGAALAFARSRADVTIRAPQE